jgi:hypothetical protein
MRTALFIASILIAASIEAATVRGGVRDTSGATLPGVTVYEKGSSDSVVTDNDGRFTLEVSAIPATIIAFLGGFDSVTIDAKGADVDVRLKLAAVEESVTVTAKAPRSVTASTYDLRPLEVLRTPGAQADVFKALQTLPGVAKVDEGAGLFVRGGDVSEVRVMLDGATIDHPFRYESPAGGQFGSITPMLLEGLAFTTGGFSARYGNALSGVLDLRGLGKPASSGWTATGGLAGVSARVASPASEASGFRASGNFSSTKLMFKLNGAPREFDKMPSSWDLNASGHFESTSLGTLKLFAMTQRDGVGVELQKEGFSGFLHSKSSQSVGIASWKKIAGEWQLSAALGANTYSKGIDVGVIDLTTTDHRLSTRFDAARMFGGLVLRTGADADRADTRIEGVKPLRGNDYNGANGSVSFAVDYADAHGGAYAELEKTFGRFTPTLGVRVDRSQLLGTSTIDPRANLTVALTANQKLRFAWGVYHQAPAPSYFDAISGATSLKPMQATHWIAGYELGTADGPYFVRVEGYDKKYDNLPIDDPALGFSSDGYGFARGIDFFASRKWTRFEVRAAFSILDAQRRWTPADQQSRFTIPDGTWSPDFDIPQSLSIVATANVTSQVAVGMTFTSASGRPTTPIIGAKQGAFGLTPIYGAINSERFPAYQRLDMNVTTRPRAIGQLTVLYFLAVNNAFARRNVTEYAYSADYTSRTPVVSLTPRSFYVGFTLIK